MGEFLDRIQRKDWDLVESGGYRDSRMLPRGIYKKLTEKVFGQDAACKTLSVVLFQHLKNCEWKERGKKLPKTNCLLAGPTGCGKTLLARTMAQIVELPFVRIDATNLVQRGYRGGMHNEQIADVLIAQAGGFKGMAENAIVFVDEIDKLRFSRDEDLDCHARGVQNDLLSLMDGGTIYYEPAHEEYGRKAFDTSNLLFIFSGAFSELVLGVEDADICAGDLINYGFMPEFANRIGTVVGLNYLSGEVIKKLVRKMVEEYTFYLPMPREELNVYTELIHSMLMRDESHTWKGGRCVGPMVRKFFEERMFEMGDKQLELKLK
ncbi:MAG: AAA family ATPase [Candidatus Margulisiibacteriota bacterium]